YAIKVAANANCDFVIAWRDDQSLPRIRFRSYHSDGTPVQNSDRAADPMVSTHKNFNPGIGMADDGSFIVVFTENSAGGTVAERFNFDQSPKDAGKSFVVTSLKTHSQNATGIGTSSDGSFVVDWREDGSGAVKKVNARLFNKNAVAVGGDFTASI